MDSNTLDAPSTNAISAGDGDKYVDGIRERLKQGENLADIELLQGMRELYAKNPTTLVPLLGMLTLAGKPYNLYNHFPMEPMFKVSIPKRCIWKCARQLSKSTSISANGVLRSVAAPRTDPLRSLYITPRYEQVRRLSTNYVRPFISGSIIRPLMVNEECTQAVLQRSFANGSVMYFSFAFLDCDRVRGLSTDCTFMDEIQDMDTEFIPVIHSCMDASMWGISIYSGTPKTMDNGIEELWQDSTKAEWVIPCFSCGYWNMAALKADLIKMTGRKGVICAKCQKPVNPRAGHWYHTDPRTHPDFHGYHVPQIIMPMHYENPQKWGELIAKSEGQMGYNQSKFLNEVMGESVDSSIKLITITDIREASKLGPNDYKTAVNAIRKCRVRMLGVDWGGGGQEEISYTVASLCGMDDVTGQIKCFYAFRFPAGTAHDEEAKTLLRYFREAGCQFMCHDYGGSGSVRETLMIQAGLPIEKIMGFLYTGRTAATRDLIVYNRPAAGELRGYWSVDKSRSLVLQAYALKSGTILLPEYESAKGITSDFLSLYEDKQEWLAGADIYRIRRAAKKTDDFAHSLNYCCLGIWHSEQRYPDLSKANNIKLTQEQLNFAAPANPWRESN